MGEPFLQTPVYIIYIHTYIHIQTQTSLSQFGFTMITKGKHSLIIKQPLMKKKMRIGCNSWAETWGDWGGTVPQNMRKVVFVGCARKHEQSKKGVIKELFSEIGVFLS